MTEQTRDILITGASLLGGEPTDIALSGGTIVAIGADARNAVRDPRIIDAEGLIALPGLVDLHTHLREPGREDAETIATGRCGNSRRSAIRPASPSMPGMRISMSTTSGSPDDRFSCSRTSSASCPSPASATTRRSGALRIMSASPRRA